MRVLFWSDLFWPYVGGPERFSARLLPALRDLGYQFTVITSHHDRDLPDRDCLDGIPIYRFAFRRALEQKDVNALGDMRDQVTSLTHAFAPALVHMSAFGPSVLFYLMTPEVGRTPLIATVQHELLPISAQPRSLLARLMDAADWVRTVSESVLSQLRQWKPELTNRSSVIYSFVEPRHRPIVPVSFEPPVILCLGRLVPVKGFDLAVQAFAHVIKRFPSARLIIAGDGVSRDALNQQVAAAGLSEQVAFIGWVKAESVWEVLDSATLALIPSRREGLPTVAIQAALAERPIIAADVGGMSEVVIPDRTGLLVNAGDVAALTRAMCALLTCPDRAWELAAAAQRHALDRFSKPRCVAQFDALYRKLARTREANLDA